MRREEAGSGAKGDSLAHVELLSRKEGFGWPRFTVKRFAGLPGSRWLPEGKRRASRRQCQRRKTVVISVFLARRRVPLDNQIASWRCADRQKMGFLFHAENFSISTSMGSVLRKKVQPAQVDPLVGFLFKLEWQRPRTDPAF